MVSLNKMRHTATIILMIFSLGIIKDQDIDTFYLKYGVSKYDTVIYNRIIESISDRFQSGRVSVWYIAAKYPDKFAAIAPISGFTSHMDFIDKNIDRTEAILVTPQLEDAHLLFLPPALPVGRVGKLFRGDRHSGPEARFLERMKRLFYFSFLNFTKA